jgi:hypothetical protein
MADIQISDVTTTEPNGTGVFDVLMRSVESHLDKQYNSGRIKGAEYATVYLGALQAVLQQAISFTLQEQKVEADIALQEQQTLSVTNDIAIKTAQSSKDLLVKDAEIALRNEQVASSQANTSRTNTLSTKQGTVFDKQALSFDRDYKYKVFKGLMDIRVTGLTQGLEGIYGANGNHIIGQLVTDAGLTNSPDSNYLSPPV